MIMPLHHPKKFNSSPLPRMLNLSLLGMAFKTYHKNATRIHFHIWQNQYNIVKFKKKKKRMFLNSYSAGLFPLCSVSKLLFSSEASIRVISPSSSFFMVFIMDPTFHCILIYLELVPTVVVSTLLILFPRSRTQAIRTAVNIVEQ